MATEKLSVIEFAKKRMMEEEKNGEEQSVLYWAAYRSGDPLANPYTSRNLEAEIRERQRSAEVDDGWTGRIEEYLDQEARLNKVCLDEIWYEAINYGSRQRQPSSADKRRIGSILTTKLGWIRGNVDRFETYGRQKSFIRPSQLTDG